MSEINNKLLFKNNSLSSLFKKIENDLTKYIDAGQSLQEKTGRKAEVISAMENFTSKLRHSGKCPEGTVWDPITRTCKSV